MKQRWSVPVLFGLLFGTAGAIHAADALCPKPSAGNGQVKAVITAIHILEKSLNATQRASLERPFVRESAIRWSNLPVGITSRMGLRLGNLDDKQNHAARGVAAAALLPAGSSCSTRSASPTTC
jgi:hypothetical protein